MKKLLGCLILTLIFTISYAQDNKLVQFSGLIITSDSLQSIPYASVLIKDENRGTISDYRGFFSLVARTGDTVIFSSVGYARAEYIIPRKLKESKYSIIQLLTQDTIHLPETVIYPWPTPEQFRQAFLSLNIPDDDLERARKNLERERLKEIGDAMAMDANENKDYYIRQQAAKFYYAGQLPPMNIFNPIAWGQFFEAWKRGDFKRKN